MAVNEDLSAYSTTAVSNTPAGSDTIGPDLDNHIRDVKRNIRRVAAHRAEQTAGAIERIEGAFHVDLSATPTVTVSIDDANDLIPMIEVDQSANTSYPYVGSEVPSDIAKEFLTASSTASALSTIGIQATNDGGSLSRIVRKTSDETVSGTTTLQADDDLTFSVTTSAVVVISGHILFNSNSTANFKHRFSGPTGAAGSFGVGAPRLRTGGDVGGTGFYALGATLLSGGHSADASQAVHGVVRNGANPGSVTLEWAQDTSDASDTKVLTDSYLLVQKE